MSQAKDSNNSINPTNHPRVYHLGSAYDRGEIKVATKIANALEKNWRVIVTIGPYRGYDLQYELHSEKDILHLDFYSVRPCGGYNISEVISDIKESIRQSESE